MRAERDKFSTGGGKTNISLDLAIWIWHTPLKGGDKNNPQPPKKQKRA